MDQDGRTTPGRIGRIVWVAGLLACLAAHAQPEDTPDQRGQNLSYPVPGCPGKDPSTPCVAKFFIGQKATNATDQASDGAEKAHTAKARSQTSLTGFPEACVPLRFLELWDPEARAVSEEECGLAAGALAPVGRYFGCETDGQGPGQCGRLTLGVALEGGGSRSAPFALGVLAGLHKSGALAQTRLITSASGGTYAAYFYFARLMERSQGLAHGTPIDGHEADRWFADCVPSVYDDLFPQPLTFCEEERLEPRKNLAFMEKAPYQFQVRAGQDLLLPVQTLRQRGESWYDWDWIGSGTNIAWQIAQHLVTSPPHWIAHGVFDWPPNFAPSAEAYRAGIERAYGHSPASWTAAQSRQSDRLHTANEELTDPRFQLPWTLADLRQTVLESRQRCAQAGELCDVPSWIMATTSTAGRNISSWIITPPKDAQRFAFELGPMGHGSGLLGFLNRPPDMSLRNAVGTSAAFLDDEQRLIVGNRFLVGAGLFLINGDWGSEIKNFNVSDGKRRLYKAMIWPFYGLPVFQGLRAPYVHLTDGGNADNLGILPQLRRGVRNIVVSASTDDKQGEFSSLCKLKNELELERRRESPSIYTLLMPGLRDLDEVCNLQLGAQEEAVWGREAVRQLFCERSDLVGQACEAAFRDRHKTFIGYDLWKWNTPVLVGCVIRRADMGGRPAESPRPEDPHPCDTARAAQREISRLFVLKPALWLPNVATQMAPAGADGRKAGIVRCQDASRPGPAVTVGTGPTPAGPVGMEIPCQALAFMHSNWDYKDAGYAPSFPQHNFILQTIHSSYTLYGAYMDLARHYASGIRLQDGEVVLSAPQAEPMAATRHASNPPPVAPFALLTQPSP